MRKWTSYSFIWLATFLLIGHSLVPHVHAHSEVLSVNAKTCHSEASYGFLAKLFSVDIGGEGHLENFLNVKSGSTVITVSDYDFECSSYFYSCCFDITLRAESDFLQEIHIERNPQFLRHYFLSSQTLRAPPLV